MSLSFFKSHQKNYINKPFANLQLKQRAIFILHLSGFTYNEIQKIIGLGRTTISQAISKGFREYGSDLGTIFPKSEGI